jgi:hypothetical protein
MMIWLVRGVARKNYSGKVYSRIAGLIIVRSLVIIRRSYGEIRQLLVAPWLVTARMITWFVVIQPREISTGKNLISGQRMSPRVKFQTFTVIFFGDRRASRRSRASYEMPLRDTISAIFMPM